MDEIEAVTEYLERPMTDRGYVPVYTTAVLEQPWDRYTRTDHEVWATLFERQQRLLVGRASSEFLQRQRDMNMSAQRIPRVEDLNCILRPATGWEIICVEGLLPGFKGVRNCPVRFPRF